MRRIKLVLAYDGTNYSGWQYQNNAVTIEEVLNKALSGLLGEKIAVIGASRTDAGVHALENVAVFDTENRMAADKICLALNTWLPEDIRALSSEETAPDWHPRKQNCTKTYEYRILNRKINLPTQRLYSYFCYFPLDVEKMRAGAACLVGEHDFKSFCAPRGQAEETVRTIYSLDILKQGDMITLRISGSGFLYNMVRIIAGTLIKVGIGVYPPEHVEEILDRRDRRLAGPTAPAKGLTLVSMEYEAQLRERIAGENKDWSYELFQREIAERGIARLIIHRCKENDFDRLLLRVTHQAMRNGAREVYVWDQEEGRRRGIEEGRAYGYYTFHHACDVVTMTKPVEMGPLSEESSDRTGQAPGLSLYSDEDERQAAPGQQAFSAPVRLKPVSPPDAADLADMANRIFDRVTGAATVTEEETAGWLSECGSHVYYICRGEETAGFMRLVEQKDRMEVKMIGVAEVCRRQGLARRALSQAEAMAREKGLPALTLDVSTADEPAVRLCENYGFRREKQVSRWYSWLRE